MTSKKKDPRYRMAQIILRRLGGGSDIYMSSALSTSVRPVEERFARLQRTWRLLETAECRRWHAAARHLGEHLLLDTHTLLNRVNDLFQQHQQFRQAADEADDGIKPSLRPLIDDLAQLEDEFEQVHYRLKEHVIAVQTEPIVLQELALGPFAIELDLKYLSRHPDPNCFRCIALEPNPASSNDSVTHPHVQDAHLCAGDATIPIATALEQGRICDAFCLVRAVLQEYNPHSPYVAIEEWQGVRCEDCNASVDRDELFYCEECGHDVCSDCRSRCDLCEESCCNGCLERDDVSHRDCCPQCRHTCSECGRTVDGDSFVADTELCPECEAERLEREQEEQADSTQDEENDHADDQQPDERSPTIAATGDEQDPGERQPQAQAPAPSPPLAA